MVKAVITPNRTISQTEQAGPKPYQQGTIPGFEMVAPAPTPQSLPVSAGGDHAILIASSTTSADADTPSIPTSNPDPARLSHALKTKARARARAKRGSWPAGVPVAQGYVIYAFYKHQPDKNILREYRLEYAPSLWSAHVVARSWGRRGGKERLAHLEFTDQAEALEYLRRQVTKRVGRGYVLVS